MKVLASPTPSRAQKVIITQVVENFSIYGFFLSFFLFLYFFFGGGGMPRICENSRATDRTRTTAVTTLTARPSGNFCVGLICISMLTSWVGYLFIFTGHLHFGVFELPILFFFFFWLGCLFPINWIEIFL